MGISMESNGIHIGTIKPVNYAGSRIALWYLSRTLVSCSYHIGNVLEACVTLQLYLLQQIMLFYSTPEPTTSVAAHWDTKMYEENTTVNQQIPCMIMGPRYLA